MTDYLISIYAIAFIIAVLLFVFIPRRNRIARFFKHDFRNGPKSYHLRRIFHF